jgi:hypothetical protein
VQTASCACKRRRHREGFKLRLFRAEVVDFKVEKLGFCETGGEKAGAFREEHIPEIRKLRVSAKLTDRFTR